MSELPEKKPFVSGIHGGWRRALGIAALLGCLAAAYWHQQRRGHDLEVSVLLTHVAAQVPGALLGRERLVEVTIATRNRQGARLRLTMPFVRGQAPEATKAEALEIAADVTTVEIGCQFSVQDGGTTLRTRTNVAIDPSRQGVQTLDPDDCGRPVP